MKKICNKFDYKLNEIFIKLLKLVSLAAEHCQVNYKIAAGIVEFFN